MLPQGSGLGEVRMSRYAIAPQPGHRAPVAGLTVDSSALTRSSNASISLGAACMRFQLGMRSSAFITSSRMPMKKPFVQSFSCSVVGTVIVAQAAIDAVAAGGARLIGCVLIHAATIFFCLKKVCPRVSPFWVQAGYRLKTQLSKVRHAA